MPEMIIRRLRVDRNRLDADAIKAAWDVLSAAGVVAIPTDTLYGLAADPFDAKAVARVFEIKGRSETSALPLIAADLDQVTRLAGPLDDDVARLASRFWPGPLTLLVPAPGRLAPAVTAGTGRVGIRVPDHPVARALCHASGRLLTATSANRSGEPPTADPDEVARTLGDRVELLLDAGPTAGGPPSTVLDVSGGEWRIVRAGAVGWDEIRICRKSG